MMQSLTLVILQIQTMFLKMLRNKLQVEKNNTRVITLNNSCIHTYQLRRFHYFDSRNTYPPTFNTIKSDLHGSISSLSLEGHSILYLLITLKGTMFIPVTCRSELLTYIRETFQGYIDALSQCLPYTSLINQFMLSAQEQFCLSYLRNVRSKINDA